MKNKNIFIVVGSHWGDEGKGKIVDLLSYNSDVIIRWSGGNNAGHTVMFNNNKYHLSVIPSGIFNENAIKLINSGCVIDLKKLVEEIEYLEQKNIKVKNLFIAENINLILPYHIELDKASDKNNYIGTTKKGISFAYQDKISRFGLKLYDLYNLELFKEKLKKNILIKNKILKYVYDSNVELDFEVVFKDIVFYFNKIKDKILKNPQKTINNWILQNKKILFEGAQGTLLDIDHGTYPFVTSSNCVASAIPGSIGNKPIYYNNILGVVKSYISRVGSGPLPTLINDIKTSNYICTKGYEIGVVTKRKRRVGWFDIVATKYSILVSGMSSICLTLLDVLSGLKKIKICVSYTLNNKVIDYFPISNQDLIKCKPNYITLDGWSEEITSIKKFKDLPKNAQNYILKIQELLKIKVEFISVGKSREQNIFIDENSDYKKLLFK